MNKMKIQDKLFIIEKKNEINFMPDQYDRL